MAIFTDKQAQAASWLTAKGLVKSMADHFHRQKSACGKLVSRNRAWQILGCHFHQKKAPAASWLAARGLVNSWVAVFNKRSVCGKLVSSNRDYQVSAKVPVSLKHMTFGPKWVEIRRFGLKICQNGWHGLSGPFRSSPAARTTLGVWARRTTDATPLDTPRLSISMHAMMGIMEA